MSPGMNWKLTSTATVTRRFGSLGAGGVTVIDVIDAASMPAEVHTSLTRAVTAASSGAVTTASLAPSRAAEVRTFIVIQARPNSVIPKRRTRSSGRTSANSITDCPRFSRAKETSIRFLSTSTPPE